MNWFKKFIGNEQGLAALEFALAAPMLVALLMGSIDTMHVLLLHQKVEKVAYTMADLVSQDDQLTLAQLSDYYLAPEQIMKPMSFGANGVVIITSIYRAQGDANAKVRWRSSGGGTLVRTSKLGAINANAVLPRGLTLNEKDNVIVAEVYYQFTPLVVPAGVLTVGTDIYNVAIFKPRLGSMLSAPI